MLELHYEKDDKLVTYDDEDEYGVEIVPTHYARDGHDFDNPGPNQSETSICVAHGDKRFGSCMFEDHMHPNEDEEIGYSKPAIYLNRDLTRAKGKTGNGANRTAKFRSYTNDPLQPVKK